MVNLQVEGLDIPFCRFRAQLQAELTVYLFWTPWQFLFTVSHHQAFYYRRWMYDR